MAIEILNPDYIIPDNDIWLLSGVPLEDDYENTIIWTQGVDINGTIIPGESLQSARERQYNYFISTIRLNNYQPRHLPSFTYIRENRKYVRVDLPYKDILKYNYMVFKNIGNYTNPSTGLPDKRYEEKNYYAFITSYEYVNDRTTLIHYKIDYMQTYMFDHAVMPCFVEREHSSTDNIGENTIDENLPVGEYIYTFNNDVPQLRNWGIAICCPYAQMYNSETGEYDIVPALGTINGNLYSGTYISTFVNASDANAFIVRLTNAGNKSEEIQYITMIPTYFGTGYSSSNLPSVEWLLYTSGESSAHDLDWTYLYNGKTGPRNKKLYSYPFNKLVIDNGNGDINDFNYELFSTISSNQIRFNIVGTIVGKGEILATPKYYKGVDTNYLEKISITGLPQCSWNTDTYKAWLAQNAAQRHYAYGRESVMLGANAILMAATAGAVPITTQISSGQPYAMQGEAVTMGGFSAGSGLPGMLGNVDNILSMLARQYDASRMPNKAHGVNTMCVSLGEGILNFRAYNAKIKPEYASIIDDFFDMYGYATKRLKIPNRNVRPFWCYTKTKNCRLVSTGQGLPAGADNVLRAIYDNGVRFWKNPALVGDYNHNNSPV